MCSWVCCVYRNSSWALEELLSCTSLCCSRADPEPGKDKDISPCSVSLLGFGVTAGAAEEPQALCSRAGTPQGGVLSSLHLSGPKAIKIKDVSDVTQMAVAPHWDQWSCAGTQGFVLNPNRKPWPWKLHWKVCVLSSREELRVHQHRAPQHAGSKQGCRRMLAAAALPEDEGRQPVPSSLALTHSFN